MTRFPGDGRAVATLAALLALTGCGGGGDDGGSADPGDVDADVVVEAGDLYFDPEQIDASAGEIEIALDNVGSVEHDFVIEEAGDTEVAHTDPGGLATGTIELEPGSYTYYCSIPGHRNSMEGTLEVE